MREFASVVLALCLAAASHALAADSYSSVEAKDGWQLVANSKDLTIYSRVRSGSPIKEFRAIGPVDASSDKVHAVLDDTDSYPAFMPYTAECRLIKKEVDSIIAYQRISPKICSDRDYTLRVWKKSWPVADGFAYLSRWETANELGPVSQKGVVRVQVCEGSWLLEPDGALKTRATYSVYTDSGGAIPVFIANRTSQAGINKVFAAVRKQVKDPKYDAIAKKEPEARSEK